jgi:uncharacterized protein (DUF433 family)
MSPSLSQPDSIQTDIDRLDLPPSLERIGRSIRIAGHRISLVQVLDAVFDGTSTERTREMFPTIPAWKLDEVLAFCEQNIDLMRRYHGEQRAALAAAEVDRSGAAPTLAELRRRKAEQDGPGTHDD